MTNFRLDLVKQLINGFTQRKRKRRSQGALNQPVAREEHISVHVQGRKRSVFNAYRLGKEQQKDIKLKLASSVVCARSHFATHATMKTTLEHK